MYNIPLILSYILVNLVAAGIQASFGFGYGILLVAFLSFFVEPATAVIFNLILSYITNLFFSAKYFRFINWKMLLPILIPSVLICGITSYFSLKVDNNTLYLLLGCFFLFLSIYSFCFAGKLSVKPTLPVGIGMGVICGILSGLFSLSGPLVALYFLSAIKEKKSYVGTMQMFFLITNSINLIVRLASGSVALGTHLPALAIGFVCVCIGTLFGLKLFKNVDGVKLERGVYTLIGLNGIWIIISHLFL